MAIDPGVTASGMVLLDGRTFVQIDDIKTKQGFVIEFGIKKPDDSFDDLMRRVHEQVDGIMVRVFDWRPGVIVIESFEDFGPEHLRGAQKRYYAPLVIGALSERLRPALYEPFWQSPHKKTGINLCVMSGAVIYSGQEKLTNEHRRDAAKHALAWQRDHFFEGAKR
jgi:hypothetical protein